MACEEGLVVLRMIVLCCWEEDREEVLWVEVEYLHQYQYSFCLFCVLCRASFFGKFFCSLDDCCLLNTTFLHIQIFYFEKVSFLWQIVLWWIYKNWCKPDLMILGCITLVMLWINTQWFWSTSLLLFFSLFSLTDYKCQVIASWSSNWSGTIAEVSAGMATGHVLV